MDATQGICEYVLTVKHDHGTVRIRTSANNTGAAIRKIMEAEGCPRRAILKCRNVTRSDKVEPAIDSRRFDRGGPYTIEA